MNTDIDTKDKKLTKLPIFLFAILVKVISLKLPASELMFENGTDMHGTVPALSEF